MNSIRRTLMSTAFAAFVAGAVPAAAQQAGTPAFRVPIGSGQATSSAPPVYAWLESISECSSTCGSGSRTTSHQCQNATDFDYSGGGYGAPEADSLCAAAVGPKPAPRTSPCTNYSGCGYDWVKPPVQQTPTVYQGNPIGRIGCGQVRAVFSPYCQRTGGASTVVLPGSDHRFCRNDTPDYNQVAAGDPDALGYDRMEMQYGACSTPDHEWRPKDETTWSGWSSTCSNSATRTRTVSCHRRFDNTLVGDDQCDAATKPASSETRGVYDSCSYDWIGGSAGDWSAWSSTCSTTATRTRNPQCRRSNGDVVADSECTGRSKPRPATSETAPVYSSCTYAAGGTTTNGAWSSTCSANAQRSVTRQCIRSNGDVVADSECTSRGTPVTTTQTQAVYDGCSYAFQTGGWGGWSSTCSSSASRTRSVTCVRSDGTAMSDAECTNRGIARPASSETQAVYDACTYAAGGSTSYGGWSSTCSANAQRSVNRQCIRSNGDVVANAECTNRGVATTSTQTTAVYDGCGYGYSTGGWSAWSSQCSSASTRTRSVTCMRSDGTPMSDSECANRGIGRPASSETAPVYAGCTYAPGGSTSYGGWSSTCSANAQRSVTRQCVRSDGAVVADAECTNRGVATTSTQTAAVYDGCGYSYAVGGWSAWNSACSANATRSRSVQCTRSDGTAVGDAECANRSVGRPASTETAPNYSGCGYSFSTGGWSGWSSTCSASATRTRAVQCYRSDGTPVGDAECTNRGIGRPASSETAAVYDGCGYGRGAYTGSSNWSSTCSASATRTNYYNCNRSDGAVVGSAECTNRGVAVAEQQTAAVYDGCGYGAVNWSGWSPCANNSQSSTAQCQRSDGTMVASNECTNRGVATTRYQTCRSGPPPGLMGRYCVGGTEVARVETSRSGGYQDPYMGKGPGSNGTWGNVNDPTINCYSEWNEDHSEYGTYEYYVMVRRYYSNATGVSEDPYYAGWTYGSHSEVAYTM